VADPQGCLKSANFRAVRRLFLLLILNGCGNSSQQRHLVTSVPRLRPAAATVVTHNYVTVSVDPVTTINWRKYPEITAKVSVVVQDSSQSVEGGGGAASGVHTTLRFDDMLLIPLPSFRIHVTNESGQALSFAHARARLDDDVHAVDAISPTVVRDELDKQLVLRRNRSNETIGIDQVSAIRAAVDNMPLLRTDTSVPADGEWHGYASFKFESEQPVTHLALLVEGLEVNGQPVAPFRFPFAVERRHAARACADGSVATPLGYCKGDENELSPAGDGPCIQWTRVPNNEKGKQWWVGGEPVPNSDLHSTLMAQPASRLVMRRGLVMSGFGYSLILAGLGLTAATAYSLSHTYGSSYGPAGISMLAVSIAGGALAVLGNRRADVAIRAYNEQADAGGVCSVVW
jgi:hypothetical protein